MKKLFICVFILSLQSLGFETGQYFTRIDEEGAASQCAYRSYIKEDENHPGNFITVQLIGMQHIAVPSFYDAVQGMIKGKVVLYELNGVTLQQSKENAAKWQNLPSPHKERFQRYFRSETADCFGRVSQNRLSYDQCRELIHADDPKNPFAQSEDGLLKPDRVIDFEQLTEKDFAWVSKHGSEEDRKKAIDARILSLMKREGIDCEESSIDEKLDFLIQKENEKRDEQMNCFALTSMEINSEIDCRKDVDFIRSGVWRNAEEKRIGDFDKYIKIDRNEFIFTALKDVLGRSEVPSEIAVPYGAAHLPLVEDFLLSQGFAPLAGSDGWLTTAPLHHLPAKKINYVATDIPLYQHPSVSIVLDKDAEKYLIEGEISTRLLSPDGFTTVHLFGPLDNRFWLGQSEDGQVFRLEVPSDEGIVKKILCNGYREEGENMIEETNRDKTAILYIARIKAPQKLEIAFTPSHLLAVYTTLRSTGFQVIDEIAPSKMTIREPMLIVAPNIMWPASK